MIANEWDDIRIKAEILKHIKNETFVITRHAAEEQKNDGIDLQDIIHVLKTGRHERGKTQFDNAHQTWKYAIEGKTKDLEAVRIIVSFLEKMIIITVFKLPKRR